MGRSMLRRFLKCESASTAIEYGLIAALISLAIVAGVGLFTDALDNLFVGNGTSLVNALGG